MGGTLLQPVSKTMEDILQGPGFYRIPRFQRPFSWSTEHVDEFWNDAVDQGEVGYFIGPMVVYSNGGEMGIVDGQQRLTTITLILAAIRDEFEGLGDASLADGTHRYIERQDRDNQMRFVLQSDVDDTAWIHQAQLRVSDRAVPPPRLPLVAARSIELLRNKIAAVVAGSSNAGTSAARQRKAAVDELKRVRDKILGLQVIWIPLANEDDAYTIFETLNSRGRDLETADLLKNFFLEALRGKNANVDSYKQRWNVIQTQFEQTKGAELRKFILHWWISQESYTAERRVFREIRLRVPKKDAKVRFDQFESDSVRYRKLVDPESNTWRIEQLAIRDSLIAFRVMGIEQPLPLFLALLRAYELGQITLKQLSAQLKIVENYHYQVTAIMAKSSSGGVSKSYASLARRLSEATTSTERSSVLSDIGKTLIQRGPEKTDFIEAFASRFSLTDSSTRDKRLVQYTLRKLHAVERPKVPLDFSKCTIEHVLPQASLKRPGADPDLVGSIGNLILVQDELQNPLAAKDFVAKKRILEKHIATYAIDDILDKAVWSADEIRARATRLAEVAYDDVWVVKKAKVRH